jgi:hypothetical protein
VFVFILLDCVHEIQFTIAGTVGTLSFLCYPVCSSIRFAFLRYILLLHYVCFSCRSVMLNQWFGALMQSFNLLPFLAKVRNPPTIIIAHSVITQLFQRTTVGARDKVSDRQRHHYRRGGRGLQSR